MSTLIGKQITKEQDSLMNSHLVKPNVDLRQVTVLSAKDWKRIQDELHYKEIEEEKIRSFKEKKQRMKENSENIIKHWPNSLMNLRQKKLDDIKKKKEDAEQRRKEKDIEWAEYQAGIRKDIIEKAKEKQYYQTERVRTLHSAYLLTEVIKEREEQIKLKALLDENEKMRDKQWADKARDENQKIMDLEKLKVIEFRNNLIDNAEFVKSQISHNADLREREKDRMRKEQVELIKLSEQWRRENEEKEKSRRERVMQRAVENRKQIEENDYIRKLQEQLEEEDDKQCKFYAEGKRKLMKLRNNREKEIAHERQSRLESIVEKLSRNVQKKKDDEDGRIKKAVAEIEAKKIAEEEEKIKKQQGVVALCLEHMRNKIKANELEKMELLKAEREELKANMEADAIVHRNDQEKRERSKREKFELREYHKKQREEKKLIDDKMEEFDNQYIRAKGGLKEQDDNRFQIYANTLIQQSAEKGRDVYPMLAVARRELALQRSPPKTPPDQDSRPQSGDRKNLGFIW